MSAADDSGATSRRSHVPVWGTAVLLRAVGFVVYNALVVGRMQRASGRCAGSSGS
jgi:hypothetical protein